jgi:hypothetical protein
VLFPSVLVPENSLFTPSLLHTVCSHRFWIAIVQICYTLLGVVFTSWRFARHMFVWEQVARRSSASARHHSDAGLANASTLADSSDAAATLTIMPVSFPSTAPPKVVQGSVPLASASNLFLIANGAHNSSSGSGYVPASPRTKARALIAQFGERHAGCCGGLVASLRFLMYGSLDQAKYGTLRHMLMRRVAADHHAHGLATLNLSVVAEQLLHKEIGHVHAHTYVQIFVMAALMLYTKQTLAVCVAGWSVGRGLVGW